MYVFTPEAAVKERQHLQKEAVRDDVPVISLSPESEEAITEWSELVKIDEHNITSFWDTPVLQEGFFELAYKDRNLGKCGFYFKFYEAHARFAFIQNGLCYLFWDVLREDGAVVIARNAVYPGITLDVEYYSSAMTYDTLLALYFMREYYRDADLVVRTETRVGKKKKGSVGKSSKKPSVTYVRRVRYELMRGSIIKTRKRTEGSWPVRGHWRRVKTGGPAWVRQHTRGTGDLKVRKYRLK